MTDARIEHLVDEIVAADPALAGRRAELTRVIVNLAKSKPAAELARAAEARIREQVWERIAAAEARQADSLLNSFSMQKLLAGIAGAALSAGIAIPSVYYYSTQSQTPDLAALIPAEVTVERVAANSFGKLTAQQGGKGGAESARPQSGGGSAAVSNVAAIAPAIAAAPAAEPAAMELKAMSRIAPTVAGGGEQAEADSVTATEVTEPAADKMIAPGEPGMYQPTVIRYLVPTELPIAPESVDVYRRDTAKITSSINNLNLMQQLGLGLVDFSKFSDAELQNISFKQDKEYGYIINIDLTTGSVNMYQNWEKWPQQPQPVCIADKPCTNGLTEADMPADEIVIAAANDFLKEYGISAEAYGAPVVDRQWRTWIQESLVRGDSPWYPEQLTVTYPLQINGQAASYEYGQPVGMQLSVDVRTKRVTSLSNLSTPTFQASGYTGASVDQVREVAARGGVWVDNSWAEGQANVRYVDLKLGLPETRLVSQWQYDQKTGMGTELFVPALVFPVLDRPVASEANGWVYAPEYVTVPLAADLLQRPEPIGRPMPLAEPAAVDSIEAVAAPAESEPAAKPAATEEAKG